MIVNRLHLIGSGVIYLILFVFGFWLTRGGKPYSTSIFTVHKLVALAGLVMFFMMLYRTNQAAALSAAELTAAIVSAIFIIGLFVSGALISIPQPMPAIFNTIHHILPYLAVLTTGITLYLMLNLRT